MSTATRTLHEQLLRLAKGAISAWEAWLKAQTTHTQTPTGGTRT